MSETPLKSPQSGTGAQVVIERMAAESNRMRIALLAAAEQFAKYADYHLAKQPPDREKAATNVEWAARCRDAADA